MPPHLARNISPHPDDLDGMIPDIRSHKVMRPDRGQSREELFYARVGGLMDALMGDLPLVDCHSVSFKGNGWNMAIATDDDGTRELNGHFHNEPGQRSTTISATQTPASGEACAAYKGPTENDSYEGDAALDQIIEIIKPHYRLKTQPATSVSTAEQ